GQASIATTHRGSVSKNVKSVRRLTERAMTTLPVASTAWTRKTRLARSSPTRVTPDVSMIDLPMDGLLPDGAFNNHHLGTLDAVGRRPPHQQRGGYDAFAEVSAIGRSLRSPAIDMSFSDGRSPDLCQVSAARRSQSAIALPIRRRTSSSSLTQAKRGSAPTFAKRS